MESLADLTVRLFIALYPFLMFIYTLAPFGSYLTKVVLGTFFGLPLLGREPNSSQKTINMILNVCDIIVETIYICNNIFKLVKPFS